MSGVSIFKKKGRLQKKQKAQNLYQVYDEWPQDQTHPRIKVECVCHHGLVRIVEPSSREGSPNSLSKDVQRLWPHCDPVWLSVAGLYPHFRWFLWILVTFWHEIYSVFLLFFSLTSQLCWMLILSRKFKLSHRDGSNCLKESRYEILHWFEIYCKKTFQIIFLCLQNVGY